MAKSVNSPMSVDFPVISPMKTTKVSSMTMMNSKEKIPSAPMIGSGPPIPSNLLMMKFPTLPVLAKGNLPVLPKMILPALLPNKNPSKDPLQPVSVTQP